MFQKVIILHDFTTEEVQEALVPSDGFTQFIRNREAQLYPPRKIENHPNPILIHKNTLKILDGEISLSNMGKIVLTKL